MIVMLIIIFILLTILYKYNIENFIDIKTYNKIMLDNNKKHLYNIALNKNIKINREDCTKQCNEQQCLILEERIKRYDECTKCNSQYKKCYNKSIIGGNCNDCEITDIKDKMNCGEIDNFGCPHPQNLNNITIDNGVKPYYIQIPDNNVNSPFNKKCVFCWNILDNL